MSISLAQQSAIGSSLVGGTSGSVLFIDSSGRLAQNNASFNWDDTNTTLNIIKRVTITNTGGGFVPQNYLQIVGSIVDNNNPPGIELKGGTLVTLYPNVQCSNGGLNFEFFGGSSAILNEKMRLTLSSSVTGSSFARFAPVSHTGTVGSTLWNLTGIGDMYNLGYARVGSATAPTNVTAGDLTFTRGFGTSKLSVATQTVATGAFTVSGNPSSLTTFQMGLAYSPTATSGTTGGIVVQSISTPASNMSGANYGLYFESGTASSQANNWTANPLGLVGCTGAVVHRGSGTVTGGAMFLTGAVTVSGGGTITTAYGYYAAKVNETGVTTAYGFYQTDTGDFNYFAGKTGLGVLAASVTAVLHLKAGTTAASTAPLKLNSGTNMTTAEAGAAEYNGNFYLSNVALRFPVGGVLFDHFADAGNTTTTETDLYSDTTAANTLNGNGDKVTASYGGIFVSSGTATRQIRAYFAGTQIFDSGTLSISAGSDAWDVEVLVIRESSTVVRCVVTMTTTGATTNAYCNYTRITSLTLSGTNILKITGQAAGVGAATNDIVAKLGTVVFEPAA